MLHEFNPIYYNSHYPTNPLVEDESPPTTVISRTQIQLNQPRLQPTARHAVIRNSPLLPSSNYEPIIVKPKSISSSAFVVQTTSFPDHSDSKVEKKIRRWNAICAERMNTVETSPSHHQPVLLSPMTSTGFQVLTMTKDDEFSLMERHREESPLPIAENPIFQPSPPPKKPPRTFEQENLVDHRSTTIDENIPSASTDLGMSCEEIFQC